MPWFHTKVGPVAVSSPRPCIRTVLCITGWVPEHPQKKRRKKKESRVQTSRKLHIPSPLSLTPNSLHIPNSRQVTWCRQRSNSNNKITNDNNNNNICPKGTYTQRACFNKYKEIHRWYYIQPTINTAYHISYCWEGVCGDCKPLLFSVHFWSWTFLFATSLSQFSQGGDKGERVSGLWPPHVSACSCSSSSSPWCRRLRGFLFSFSSFRSLDLRAPISGSPYCQ